MPDVSGIRTGTSSNVSSGAGPRVPDGGISSAGNEYGPRISLLSRLANCVMPIVVKRFGW